jgi:hypothetical protein
MPSEEQTGQLPNIMPFYNQEGRAIVYLFQGNDFYLYDGTPIAWLQNGENIYSYDGKYLGRLRKGCISDLRGYAAFFTIFCSGGPARPVRQAHPIRGPRGARRARYASEAHPARPALRPAWSSYCNESFFLAG